MDLVIMKDQQAVTSSLQVAKGFEKKHKDVMKAIDNKISSAQNCAQYKNMFAEGTYQDKSGKANKMYYMNRDGFTFIAMGFTGRRADEFKLRYIDAFNKMQTKIQMQLAANPRTKLKLMYQFSEETAERVDSIETDVAELKENRSLDPGEYGYVSRRISQRVYEVAKGYPEITQKQIGYLFKDINSGIKTITGIRTRTQLKQKHFEKVMDYINDWEPSTATKTMVRQTNLFDENSEVED